MLKLCMVTSLAYVSDRNASCTCTSNESEASESQMKTENVTVEGFTQKALS